MEKEYHYAQFTCEKIMLNYTGLSNLPYKTQLVPTKVGIQTQAVGKKKTSCPLCYTTS